jgi:hypothetical protein
MFNKTKIAFSLALVVGTASAAMAVTKHSVHHHRVAVARPLPGAGAHGYATSRSADPGANSPTVLDALQRQAAGDPRCWGGNCDPNWGQFTNY